MFLSLTVGLLVSQAGATFDKLDLDLDDDYVDDYAEDPYPKFYSYYLPSEWVGMSADQSDLFSPVTMASFAGLFLISTPLSSLHASGTRG